MNNLFCAVFIALVFFFFCCFYNFIVLFLLCEMPQTGSTMLQTKTANIIALLYKLGEGYMTCPRSPSKLTQQSGDSNLGTNLTL